MCTWKDASPDTADCNGCGESFETAEQFEAHFERAEELLEEANAKHWEG